MKHWHNAILTVFFVLTAFTSWLPHSSSHNMHDKFADHHGADSSHNHEHHQDIAKFLGDYLHIDLQAPSTQTFKAPSQSQIAMWAAPLATSFHLANPLLSKENKSRAPPDSILALNTPPIYLQTQRLRI